MLTRRIGVALLAAGLSIGCDQAHDEAAGDKAAATSATPAHPAQKQASSSGAPLARIDLDAPTGWAKQPRGAWQIHTSADEKSVLALGPIDDGAPTREALDEAAHLLGISDVHWAEEQAISIGVDHLSARASDGPCRFRNGDARVAYAAVDVGEGERILVIHLATNDAPADAQKTALTAVASLRKKR
jgi:hypothetical protein